MRFVAQFILEQDHIHKDKNRIFTSWLKHFMEAYDEELYHRLYKRGAVKKDFTFSLYLGEGSKFLESEIYIPSKQILMNISCGDDILSVHLYNIMQSAKSKVYQYRDLSFCLESVQFKKEKAIQSECITVKTLSPIIIREHKNHDNQSTYYYDLSEQRGKTLFFENLKHQLFNYFGENAHRDIEELKIEILSTRTVRVVHYGIVIPTSLSSLKLSGKAYLLTYLYQAGIGAMRSSGFGMLEHI